MSEEIGKTILGPCARDGNDNDWWGEQHIHCTGSHHVNSEQHILCTCSCHDAIEPYQALADNFNQEYESAYGKFVEQLIPIIASAIGIPKKYILNGMEVHWAIGFQRYYTQTGPWADMLNEVI
jgi:hypothetical protein